MQNVGLALGGSMSRGFAHIGVIKVLLQEGIKIDYIAGTSMGSVVAALYACGLKITVIEQLAQGISRRIWLDMNFPRMGFIAGERLEELIYLLTGRRKFEDLSVPLAVVATDLETGGRVVLRQGLIAKAVRASCATPGIFNPTELNGRLLVDGGVLERVPSAVVRGMGADFVIAVDVGSTVEQYKISHIFDILSKSIDIMSREIYRTQAQDANAVITPDLMNIAPFQFHRAAEAIAQGEKAARQALPLLRTLKQRKEG